MERGVFDTASYLRLFRSFKEKSPSLDVKRKLYVLIPALREQGIIEKTILQLYETDTPYFEVHAAVITTAREKSNGEPTTEEIVARSVKSGKLSEFKDKVHIFRDPDMQGNMATQLNYALNEIRKFSPPGTPYIVYNADSIISRTTFEKLSGLLAENRGKEFAFQQPCAYVREMSPSSGSFQNALSLYQSWYCLGHESRLLRAYEKSLQNPRSSFLGVIVGHGSGMTLNIHEKNGEYPAKLLTEDLTFGFMLSANKVPILLLPALELADVPAKFATFINQKSIWFWNYLGYLDCYKAMRKKHHASRLLPLLLHGITAGGYWALSAVFIALPIISGIMLRSPFILAVSITSYLFFVILPQYILFKKLPSVLRQQDFNNTASKVGNISFIKILPALCLVTLTDSVGPWIAISKRMTFFFTRKLPEKPKTED